MDRVGYGHKDTFESGSFDPYPIRTSYESNQLYSSSNLKASLVNKFRNNNTRLHLQLENNIKLIIILTKKY